MATKWQKFRVNIDSAYSSDERESIADDIIKQIRERTQDGLDKNGVKFKPYSKAYTQSMAFQIAGKSKGDVDLTLTGDMLGSMVLLSSEKGSLLIGFKNGTEENGKADGNIRGTYGKSKPVGPARDFLGISQSELKRILLDHQLEDGPGRRVNEEIQKGVKSAFDPLPVTTTTDEADE